MKTRELYLADKYKVRQGSGAVGFCTVWSDPEQLFRQSPDLLNSMSLMGTLYSREGVNVMLRNLALNPDIRSLFVWGNGDLSRTPFGRAGVEIVENLWQNGFSPDHQVNGIRFKLHREFDLEVVDRVLKNVQLVDVSQKNLTDAIGDAGRQVLTDNYMEPVAFPEHKPVEGEPFSSEEVGFLVRGEKITDAWLRVADRVMRYGVIKETEYGNRQRELPGVQWVVKGENTQTPFFPDWPEELAKITGNNPEAIERYYPEFMSPELPGGIAYTYGQRLWNYGEENEKDGVSQIGKVIEHLKESAVTRRAVATTWNQWVDSDKRTKNPPCFVMMQALQTNGKLHLFATFRSHDIFKAAIPNAFGLRRLQEYLVAQTGFEVGSLSIVSNSAHIYEEDWDEARNLLKCAIWEREPRLSFNQDLDTDPRGVVLVRVENRRIVADFASPDGATILSFEGHSAKQIYKKLAFLDLLSRPDHWMDIAAELQKAEIARNSGLQYSQDKPLDL